MAITDQQATAPARRHPRPVCRRPARYRPSPRNRRNRPLVGCISGYHPPCLAKITQELNQLRDLLADPHAQSHDVAELRPASVPKPPK